MAALAALEKVEIKGMDVVVSLLEVRLVVVVVLVVVLVADLQKTLKCIQASILSLPMWGALYYEPFTKLISFDNQ